MLVAKLSTGELADRRSLVPRANAQSVESRTRIERIVGRPGVGHVGGLGRLCRRNRDRRLHRLACQRVRRRRIAPDLRAHQPARLHDAALDARQGRPAHAVRRRRGLVLEALHGPDGQDETVPDVPFRLGRPRDVKGLRIGYVASEFHAPATATSARQAAARRPVV